MPWEDSFIASLSDSARESPLNDDVMPSVMQFGLRRVVTGNPQPGFVPHPGYVSLFPFLMKLIPPGSKELTAQVRARSTPPPPLTPFPRNAVILWSCDAPHPAVREELA